MSSTSTQILFVDSRVANIDSLLAQVDSSYEVVLLNSEEAGLTQIANALQGRSGIEALHILSHGGDGYVLLGSGAVNADRLGYDYNLKAMSTISQALTADADILLYGCDVAASDAGRTFINALAVSTGADVAASTDVTGADFLGGDWTLEAATGDINVPVISFEGYDDALGASVSYSFSAASGQSGSPAIMTATGVTYTSGGTLNITGWDVDYPYGEYDQVSISYDGGSTWSFLTNTYGDRFLRGDNQISSVTTFTIPNFSGAQGFNGTLKLKVECITSGWVFRVSATTLSVFTNNKPTSSGNSVSMDEDGRYTFSSNLFNFSDVDNNDSFNKIKITSLPGSGTLTLNGASVSLNQEIAAGSLSGLRYTPAANWFGSTSFSYQVYDGWEWSANSATMSLVVNSVNDTPALSNGVVLMPMMEDQASNPGVTLLSKFGTYFSDVESGSMSGVVITGTTANASTEGSWQYFAGGAWHNIDGGTVTASNGLALSASTLIRFNPVANYNGTPPTLSLVATDGNFTLASYATGAAVAGNYVNTQTAPATAGLSTVPRTVGIIVLPSNDPPVFNPSGTITAGVQDTYVEDTASTLLYSAGTDSSVSSHTLTGTVSATDPETPANQLAYSIRGGELTSGTLTSGVWKLQGLYGVLTFNTTGASKTWVYTPNKFDAINALPAGATVHDAFDLKVVDADGAAATRALDITITGTNDVPLLNANIADQSFNGAGNWSFQVPADSFVDAEGLGLTYSATLDGGAALPAWLSFDPATRTFSGNPPASAQNTTLSVRVNALDTGADSHVLIDVADDATADAAQTFSIQIGATTVGPINVSAATTGTGLASAIQTAIQAVAGLNNVTASYANGVLTITDPGKHEITNVSLSNGATQIDTSIEYVNATVSDVFVLTLGNNLNDAPTGGVTISGTATQGQTLTANNTLADADTLGTFTYTWYANGTQVQTGAGNTYVLSQSDVGKSISVKISYTDVGGANEAVFSAQTARVANINDAPTSTNDSVTTLEDTAITLKLSDFGTFADVDGDSLVKVKITQLPGNAEIDATPTYTAGASSKMEFDVLASAAPEATAFSITVDTVTVTNLDVSAATDGATLAAAIQTALRAADGGNNISVAWSGDVLTVTDASGRAMSGASLVRPTGILTLNGAAVAVNAEISVADIANGKLVFTPSTNYYGAPTVAFKVTDGTDYSASAYTLTLNVTEVNDVPRTVLTVNGTTFSASLYDEDVVTSLTSIDWVQDGVGGQNSQTLQQGKSTYVKIVYTDAAGHTQTSISNPVTSVNTLTVDAAPTLTTATGVTLTEANLRTNGAQSLALAAMTAADADEGTLTKDFRNGTVWVSIQNPDAAHETVSLASRGNITITGTQVDYFDGTNTLTIGTISSDLNGANGNTLEVLLNANANGAAVTELLAALNYGNTSTAPAAQRLIDVTVSDDIGKSATETITVNITPTNTPPASTDTTSEVARGVAKVLTLADFGNFTDLENGPFNYVIITQLPSSGTLTLNNGTSDVDMASLTFAANMQATYPGTSALTGGVTGYWIPVSDIVAGKLKYTAAANSGNSVTGLQFYVEENPIATSANTVTFQLSNTPPAATGAALTALSGTEDTVQTITTASLTQGYTDADGNTLLVANLSASSGTIVDNGAGGFTYTPALNAPTALGTSAAVTLTYDIVDGFGGVVSSVQRTLNIAAVNDAVSVDAPLANMAANPGAALSIDIGNLSPFYDPDTGDTLTYSATANGQPLSFYGLSINPTTGVISGNAPGSEPYLNFVITGTDTAGTSATSTFTLDLSGASSSTVNQQFGLAANNPGAVTYTGTPTQGQSLTAQLPTDTDGMTAVLATSVNVTQQGDATHNEIATVTFGTKPSGVASMTFAGVTVDLSTATTPAQVATAVTAALSGNATWTAVNNNNGSITLTSVAQAATTDLQTSDFTGDVGVTYQWQKAAVVTGAGTQVVTSVSTTDGTGLAAESVVVTFNASGKPAGVYGVAFDGLGIDLTNASSAADMAAAVVNAINANPTTSNWTAVDNNNGTITLTADTVGNRTNLSTVAANIDTVPNATLPSFVPLGAWTDVAGSNGYGTSKVLNILQQSESENFIRVQAFYTDAAGVAETPVSGVQFVVDANDTGTVDISGTASPGYTLTGVLSDADGISSSNPSYQWQYATSPTGPWTNISGATASTYTVQNGDANRYLRVNVTTYTDNAGYTQTNTYSAATNQILLGNVAPVAADDLVTMTEHSGLSNTTVTTVSPYVGNLLTNDSDLNGNNTMSVNELRYGATAGAGTLATSTGGGTTLTYIGQYGTLVVTKATGAYTYELDQNNATVQALQTGQQLIEEFNYRVTDSGGLTDRAVLTIYIDGANDLPTITGTIPATKTVTEDVPALLDLSSAVMSIVDVDGPTVTLQLSVAHGTLRADTNVGGLTVTGADTNTLTVTASSSAALMTWLAQNNVYYLTAANANGTNYDTVTYKVSDDGGATYTTAGTTAITATAVNDALIVDAGGGIVTDGAPGVTEALDITLLPVPATATNPTPLTFDGVTLNLTPGMTIAQIGALFAGATFQHWSASVNADGTVRLTALTAGATDNLTASDFTTTNNALSPYVVTPAGNDNVVTFKPRGAAVLIAENLTLTDVDGGNLASVTLSLATGVRDNQFGTQYETLSLTQTGENLADAAGITVTATPSNNGYVLTLTGSATAADYQAVLREIVYEDSNPNAFAGDRTVTIVATDASGNASNTASVATVSAMGVVLPGMRIFINGTDTGAVVAEVADSMHFVASHALTVAAGDTITFYDTVNTPASGNSSGTAVVAAPLVSTVTVHVPWTPAIDNNGIQAGTDLTRTYYERSAPVAIATADASMTDQDGLIRNLTITLTNPQDNGGGTTYETLTAPSVAILKWLSTRGITVVGNGTNDANLQNLTDNSNPANTFSALGTVGATRYVFTAQGAGTDATNFQVALRAVGYQNMDHDPTTNVQRIVNVTSTDVDGNVGVDATTYINVGAVNDAPAGADATYTINEDTARTFTAADFGFTDALDGSNANALLAVKITSLPLHGTLTLNGTAVTAGDSVAVGDLGNLSFQPLLNANGAAADSFTFQVQDNGGTAHGGVDLDPSANTITFNITPVNDAPVLGGSSAVPTIDEDINYQLNTGVTVASMVADGSITDVDLVGAAPEAIAITAVDNTHGTWQYKVGNGTWQSFTFTGANAGKALLLDPTDSIRFVPSANWHGDISNGVTFKAWDQTTGTAGSYLTVSGNTGDINTLSAASQSIDTFHVTSVNDKPFVSGSQTATGNEDSTISLSGFTVGDADTGDTLTLEVSLADITTGSLSFTSHANVTGTFSGTTLTLVGSAADVQTALNSLKYTPSTDLNSGVPANTPVVLNLRVQDDAGSGWQPYTVSVQGKFFYDFNGHYYEFVPASSITWQAAFDAAQQRTLYGLKGYLATVTSAEENAFITAHLGGSGWMGASDGRTTVNGGSSIWTVWSDGVVSMGDGTVVNQTSRSSVPAGVTADRTFTTSEGKWTWVSGPEAGTQFWQDQTTETGGTESFQGSAINGMYANFAANEPNNYQGNEDYAHFYNTGIWNDYPNAGAVNGYVVEYGGLPGDAATVTAATLDVTVTPVNDRPVLTPASASLTVIDENAVSNAGQTVASFMGAVTDVDTGTNSAGNGTGLGIAVTTVGTGAIGGHWEFSTNSGTSWATITLTAGQALPLLSTDMVRYVPDQIGGTTSNNLTKPSLTYSAWDTSVGTHGTTTTVAALGGSAASSSLSSASDTVTIAVDDVNDAPTISVPTTYKVEFLAAGNATALNGFDGVNVNITGMSAAAVAAAYAAACNASANSHWTAVVDSANPALVYFTADAGYNGTLTANSFAYQGTGASVATSVGNGVFQFSGVTDASTIVFDDLVVNVPAGATGQQVADAIFAAARAAHPSSYVDLSPYSFANDRQYGTAHYQIYDGTGYMAGGTNDMWITPAVTAASFVVTTSASGVGQSLNSFSTLNAGAETVEGVGSTLFPVGMLEDGVATISGITLGDVDITGRSDGDTTNNNVTAHLTVSHGTISLAGTTGITFDNSTADGTSSITITGSLSAVNAAIAALTYTADTNYNGVDTLSVSVDDNGNVGSGGHLTALANVPIIVTGVNDAPVLTAANPTQALPTITENDTGNAGVLVSALVGTTAGQTQVADADTPNGANGTEAIGQGMAIYGLSVGTNGTGTWQFKLGNGAWQNAGVVDSQHALLLGASDSIRFVPDAQNSTTGTINYRLWDGASGAAGQKVDVTTNGGTTAFSTGTDSATITVTDVNDAPTVTVNNGFGSVYFGAVGPAVDVFAAGSITLGDVDIGDRVTSATVTLDAGYDLDNAFATTYEYLLTTASGGVFTINGNTITITGNGSGADGLTEATVLTLTGNASLADYEAALATIQYIDTNPNAYAGVRPIHLQITDDGDPLWSAADTPSNTATVNVNVNWGPVVDMSGPINADRDLHVTYAEGEPAVLISASNAEIKDLDGNITSVTVTLTNPQDGASERIYISDPTALVNAGITATPTSGNEIVLTVTSGAAGLDGTRFQLALRTIKYENTSQSPTAGQRIIDVNSVDVDANPGLLAHTYINVSGTNDQPVLTANGADFTTITEDDVENAGQLVSDILGTITDVDTVGTDPHSATNGINTGAAIYSLSSGGVTGTWQYKLAADQTNTWVDITSITSGKALLLGSLDSLRFVPDAVGGTTANSLTKPSLSYYAWDQATGTAGTELTIAGNQGATGTLSTGSDTVEITVTDVNDAPTITVPAALVTLAEDGNYGITGVSIGDVDISGRVDSDTTNNDVEVTLSVSHGTITLAGVAGLTFSNGSSNGSASMTFTGSLSAVNTAVATLTYTPVADYNGTDVLVIDADDLGNVGNGGAQAAQQQVVNISVTGVNDAPVLTDGTPAFTTIDENATTNTGALVSALVGAGGTSTGIADADGATAEGTEAIGQGIAVYGLGYNYNGGAVAGGQWEYKLANGSWAAVGTVDAQHALLLESTSSLRFVPDAQNGGTGTVNFYLWDGATGTAGNKVDVTTRGTTTAFSTTGDQATITVSDVNDDTVVVSEDLVGGDTELGVASANLLTDGGTITFTDVDWTGVHSFASSGAQVTTTNATPVGTTLGSVSVVLNSDTNAGGTGQMTWSYSVADTAVEYLQDGEQKVEQFTITLYDNQGTALVKTIEVTITGTNDAPVISNTVATGAVAELVTPTGSISTGNTVIGFTDVDLADTHVITSTSAITGQGTVYGSVTASVTTDTTGSGTGGQITWNYSVNASDVEYLAVGETKTEQFDVVLDDNNDGVDLQARRVSVTITGTNDAPTNITTNSSLSINEVPGAISFLQQATTVATFASTDVDASDTHTYSITGGDDAQFFQIVGNQLQLRQLTPLDAEVKRTFVVDVQTSDGHGGTYTKTFTITVNDLNEHAVVARNWLVQPQTLTVNGTPTAFAANTLPEHDYTGTGTQQSPGTFIGVTAVAEDQDATNNVVTYQLVSDATGNSAYVGRNGNAADAEFRIDAATGALYAIGNLDYEIEGGLRTLFVKATSQDGSTVVSSITLNIANVDEVPPTFTSGTTATTLTENTGAGQLVYTAHAVDTDFNAPNTANSVVYALTPGEDAAAFNIDTATGAVTLIGNPNYENQPSYAFTVRARDADGNYTDQRVTMSVTNVDDTAPTITSGGTAVAINENSGAGQVVYTVTSDDAVLGDVVASGAATYGLGNAGGDEGLFSIDAATGAVTLIGNPDFEAKANYSFEVVATDAAGNARTQVVTLAINNLDEVAPTITSGTTATAINENSGANQTVYTVTSTDTGDISGGVSYSLADSGDAAAFTIDAATGAVTLTGNPNHEAQSSYTFTVVATDAAGNASQQTVTLAINDLDDTAPTITSAATAAAIDENSGAAQVVYTVTSDDTADVSAGVTYSLGSAGGDEGLFSIDANTGAVTLTGNPNHEAKANYSFEVVATDAAGNASQQTVTLAINDLDEVAPTITSGATAAAINENSGANQTVYTVTSTDTGDISAGVTYSLGNAGGDEGLFSIDAATGAVTLIGNPDFEAKANYSFEVVATDLAGNASQQTVTLAINNRDEVAPTITSGGTAAAIDENSGAAQVVYTAVATDAGDTSGGLSYSLADSGDAAAFTIDAATGAVTLTGNPNHEAKSSYTFTVVATDAAGNASQQTVTLAINDLDDTAPTITSAATAAAVDENSGAAQVIYTVISDDTADVSAGVTYSLGNAGGDEGLFSIDTNTGAVTLTGNPNHEAKANYSFEVVATDLAGNASQQTVTLAINDLDEVAPTITSGATAAAINENSGANQTVYTVTSTDTGDISAGVTYSLANTGDFGAFTINANTGVVKLTGNPNYETKDSYSFTVVATDAAGNASQQAVTLAINDMDDQPTGEVIINGAPVQGRELTVTHPTLADEDGINAGLGYYYQWFAEGEAIADANGATLTLGQAQVGKHITVMVRYTDGNGNVNTMTSQAQTRNDSVTVSSLVGNVNDAPAGAPAIAGALVQGQTLTATQGTLADLDGLGTVSYQWFADGVAIANANTATLTLGQAQVGKVITVRASYTDDFGQAESVFSAATPVVANTNDAPTGAVLIGGTATQGQTLTATNTLVDTDGMGTVTYQWLADGQAILGATSSSFTLGQDQVGKAISVRASYTDLLGTNESMTSMATTSVANVNDPLTGGVQISGTATQGQTLTAINNITDADGVGALSYQWLADGVAISGATGSSFTLGQAQVSKAISVRVSYTDGQGTAESTTSVPTLGVVNVNDAPTGLVTVSGTATQGQTLTAANTLADVDGMGTVSYQWLADGVAISGANGSTLTLGQAQVGKAISVRASYIDGQNTAESVTSSVTTAVANLNDLPSGSVTISGTATQGQTLTAANTLADADGMGTVTYQWLADGQAIQGATSSSFTLGQAQVGKAISVRASYTDLLGTNESMTSMATTSVANVNDPLTGGVQISGTATQGQTLTAINNITDADGVGALSYQWLADGVAISGATGSTFTLGQAQVGKAISVRVNYTDGQGTAESTTSSVTAVVANVNDLPTGSVTISGTAAQNQTLTAANTLADADGMGAVSYQWLADGVAISGATSSTFTLGQAQVGKAITVVASYTDGFNHAETVSSAATAAVADVNDAPTGSVTISGTVKQGQVLTAANTLADVDGGGIVGAVAYQWYADGSAISGATASSYTLTQAQVGKAITVKATYTDGAGFTNTKDSAATAVVANDLPVISKLAAFDRVATTVDLAGANGTGTAIYGIEAHDVQNSNLGFSLGGSVNVSGKTINDYLQLVEDDANNKATVYLRSGVTMQSLIDALGGLGSSFVINVQDGADTVASPVTVGGANSAIATTSNTQAPVLTSPASTDLLDSSIVYQAAATDASGYGLFSYSLTGTDASFFTIDSTTGAVRVKADLTPTQTADYLSRSTYSLNVQVSDGVLGNTKSTTTPVVINRPEVDKDAGLTVVATLDNHTTNNTNAVVDVTQTAVAPSQLAAGVSLPYGKSHITATQEVDQGVVPTNISLYVDKSTGVNGFWTTINGSLVNLATADFGGNITDLGTQLRIDLKIDEAFDTAHHTNFVDNGVVTLNGAPAKIDLGALGANPLSVNDLFWS